MRGTTLSGEPPPSAKSISTHVPRAGHDNFNSRAPCGARPPSISTASTAREFQLTCPVRGTTILASTNPCCTPISTHVPRAGHDCHVSLLLGVCNGFQLTCPVRGTTSSHGYEFIVTRISTHVPRAGHDGRPQRRASLTGYFNSRAPCGARRLAQGWITSFTRFQLTCPVRGTTNR